MAIREGCDGFFLNSAQNRRMILFSSFYLKKISTTLLTIPFKSASPGEEKIIPWHVYPSLCSGNSKTNKNILHSCHHHSITSRLFSFPRSILYPKKAPRRNSHIRQRLSGTYEGKISRCSFLSFYDISFSYHCYVVVLYCGSFWGKALC